MTLVTRHILLTLVVVLCLTLRTFGAVVYLRSTDGSDVDSGATWALAKATLASALTAAGAGGTVYESKNHAETQATPMTLASPGTAASPVRVICVDDTGNPEPPTARATTATVSTTGANSIDFTGFATVYGTTFQAGDSTNAASIQFINNSPWYWRLENCTLALRGSGTTARILWGAVSSGDDQLCELVNTTLSFASGSQLARNDGALVVWTKTTTGVAGTVPATLFGSAASRPGGQTYIRGVDLSAATSALFTGSAVVGRAVAENCKLGAGVVVVSGAFAGQGGAYVTLVNCDSADTNYRFYHQTYQGTITQETTIVRTGGSSDGTTPFSRKMVTTANSKIYSPLESLPVTFWNETVGSSITVAAEVVIDNVTLTDAEAWIEVEYLGTSGFPLSLAASDRVADDVFGTPANQTSSSVAWTTTGLATPIKQTLSVSLTPQEKGPIRARVMLARPSTTMYVDQLQLTGSGRQTMIGSEGIINEGAYSPVVPGGGIIR